MDMEIPYTVEVRRDTGLTNGKIGIWLFLASEVMLFGALFASYILIRTGSPAWPRGDTILSVPMATFNTLVLISSSVTMVMAWASLMRHRFETFRIASEGRMQPMRKPLEPSRRSDALGQGLLHGVDEEVDNEDQRGGRQNDDLGHYGEEALLKRHVRVCSARRAREDRRPTRASRR